MLLSVVKYYYSHDKDFQPIETRHKKENNADMFFVDYAMESLKETVT